MADILPLIEMMENRWMRAWANGDARELKALTSRKFRMVIASKPCTILDAKSWIEGGTKRFRCGSYRFGDLYARKHGSMAVFACRLELKATMDGQDWSGDYWVTDLWQKSRVRRSWQLVERVLSRPDERADLPAAIRSLQLWR